MHHRLLPTAILLLLAIPGVVGLCVGLHVALEHSEHHESEHSHASQPVQAVVHEQSAQGHHEHEAPVEWDAATLRTHVGPATVFLSFQDAPSISPTFRSSWIRPPRRVAPPPLFTMNCSLLI